MISGHGNDIHNYDGKIRYDFSSNIPYRNASAEIAEYLKTRLHLIFDYPDVDTRALTEKIAAHHTVSSENVLVTNGSAEAFYLLAHLYRNKKSTVFYPSFSEYEDACRIYNHSLTFLPIESATENFLFNADTVWFGVPNNPDGTIIANETITRFCEENPQTIFVADTAYGELCTQCQSLVPLHKKSDNLISVHSLTKTFGIPGLRLGYIIADHSVINLLKSIRMPWSVNALALDAGCFIMDNYDMLLLDCEKLCHESVKLQHLIDNIPQLEVIHSPCNFFLVKMKEKTAAELKTFLIDRFGILIRDASNFRGLSERYFRISVQDKATNELLIRGLNDFFNSDQISAMP